MSRTRTPWRFVAVCLLVMVCLWLLMGRAVAGPYPYAPRTYYVDATSGADTNTGTAENLALKTLAAATALVLRPGDRILFKRGEVFADNASLRPNYSGLPGLPIIYDAYGVGASPIISPSATIPLYTTSTTVPSAYLIFRNLDFCSNAQAYAAQVCLSHASFENCTFRGATAVGLYLEGGSVYIYVRGCTIRNNGTTAGSGIQVWGSAGEISSEIYIENCSSHSNGAASGDHAIYLHQVVGAYVRRDVCYSNYDSGIKLSGCQGGVVEGNALYSNDSGLTMGGEVGELACNANLVMNNLLYANAWNSIVFLGNATNNLFYNNTVYGPPDATGEAVVYFRTATNTGNQFYNNVLFALGARRCFRFVTVAERTGNGPYDYNDFWQDGTSPGASVAYVNAGSLSYTLAQWKVLGHDPHSSELDPMFVTEFTDFHLAFTSPISHTGSITLGVQFDYDIKTRGATPAQGCYEYP